MEALSSSPPEKGEGGNRLPAIMTPRVATAEDSEGPTLLPPPAAEVAAASAVTKPSFEMSNRRHSADLGGGEEEDIRSFEVTGVLLGSEEAGVSPWPSGSGVGGLSSAGSKEVVLKIRKSVGSGSPVRAVQATEPAQAVGPDPNATGASQRRSLSGLARQMTRSSMHIFEKSADGATAAHARAVSKEVQKTLQQKISEDLDKSNIWRLKCTPRRPSSPPACARADIPPGRGHPHEQTRARQCCTHAYSPTLCSHLPPDSSSSFRC